MSNDLQPDDGSGQEPSWAKELRKQNKELERSHAEQAAKAEAAERKLAFAEAGVPLGDPRAKYFVKGYEGDADADAIRAEWVQFSGTSAQAAAPDHSADIAAAQRIADASNGAPADDASRMQRYRDELEAAPNEQAVLAVMQKYQVQFPQPSR